MVAAAELAPNRDPGNRPTERRISAGAAMDDDAIFEYLDYRLFLRDTYRHRKEQPGGYSYRAFARRAGLGSPNYLKLVIDGDRHLSVDMAGRFGEACGLKADQLEYFRALVAFNEAKDSEERERCQRLMARFRKHRRIHPLTQERAEYHSQWFIPAIRELVTVRDACDDPAWIAAKMVPPITANQAARAIEVLLRLGMIGRNDAGRLVQAEALVSTGHEMPSSQLASYHRTMMRHASESIDRVPREARDISSLTLAVGVTGLSRLKKRVQDFRRELLQMSAEEGHPAQVVQLNMQLFPLSEVVLDAENPEEDR